MSKRHTDRARKGREDTTNPPPDGLPEEWHTLQDLLWKASQGPWRMSDDGTHRIYTARSWGVAAPTHPDQAQRLHDSNCIIGLHNSAPALLDALASERKARLEAEAQLRIEQAGQRAALVGLRNADNKIAQLTKERDERTKQRDDIATEALLALRAAGHTFTPSKPGQLAASIRALEAERDEARADMEHNAHMYAVHNARLLGLLREALRVVRNHLRVHEKAENMGAPKATMFNAEATDLADRIDAELEKSGGGEGE
jgi:hypothetical protein